MNRKYLVINAILWSVAIIASAIVGAPAFFSIFLLPTLAGSSLLFTAQTSNIAGCAHG